MTVGVAIKCTDGIVVGCDSLETFSRGAPVARYTNKIEVLEHECLQHPVALVGAGMTAFHDKFIDRAMREGIQEAHSALGRPLDIVDFADHVCEGIVASLFKEYMIDRNKFFGPPISDFSLAMLLAGATVDGATRAYIVHQTGLTESIDEYGTIGSGAAYAELFLRSFVSDQREIRVDEAASGVIYAIKGVEIMDPNVGGDTRIRILRVRESTKN